MLVMFVVLPMSRKVPAPDEEDRSTVVLPHVAGIPEAF
jgi:hypothetical protein